jgi:hypothetical protein
VRIGGKGWVVGGSSIEEEKDIPGFRLRRCSDSKAVICETVVKTSAQWVADRSIQYLSVSHVSYLIMYDRWKGTYRW